MDISIVMCVYNEEIDVINKSILSMINQSFNGKFEIIIIIDNPKNQKMISFLNDFEKKYKNITIIKNKENIGLAASLNKGISYSKGLYICRMDSDDISFPYRLQKQYDYLLDNNIDFVAGNVVLIDEEGNELGYTRNLPETFKQIKYIIRYTACLIHPTWIFKKEIWESIGGYRESMIAAQDYDFSIRAIKAGYKIQVVKDKVLKYRIRNNSISLSKRSIQTYLALYSQDNVYRNKEFDTDIYKKINNNECIEFNIFNKYFEDLMYSNYLKKVNAIIIGFYKSRIFRRFIVNTIIVNIIKIFLL